MSLQADEQLTAVGKSSWVREFLARVELSTLLKSSIVGDEEAVISRLKRETTPMGWFSLLSSPQISAYFNQSNIRGLDRSITLQSMLDHDSRAITLDNSGPVISQNPHHIFFLILRNIGRGSLGESSKNASFLRNDKLYEKHAARIRSALNMLKNVCPEYYVLVRTYLHEIILVDEQASFRGSTTYYSRGLSYFRPRESWTDLVWAEELVHETTHNYVQALATFDSILVGENVLKPTVPGPLRADVRHHYGNFQAIHVIARLIRLNDALLRTGYNEEYLKARNAELFNRSLAPFESVSQGAEFSAVGQALFDAEVRTVFDPTAYEEDTLWFRATPRTLLSAQSRTSG